MPKTYPFTNKSDIDLSDDQFTKEELAILYGVPLPGHISCEDDAFDNNIDYHMQYNNN